MNGTAHQNLPRAFVFLMLSHVCFVLLDATGKALAQDMGVPLISFMRHAGHVLLMLIFLLPTRGLTLIRTKRPALQLARGLMLTGFTVSFFSALHLLPQAEATAINFLAPFFVMLLAGPLLGEVVTWRRWAGAAGGFAGMLLIVHPGSELSMTGVGCVLITVVCNIGFQLMTRQLAATEDSMTTVFLTALIGTLVSLCLLPLQEIWGGWPQALETRHWLLFGALGVAGSLSQWFLIRAYFWSNASFIAPLVFLQLVWAALSGHMFFGQFPDGLSSIGMGVIVASGVAVMWAETRAAGRQSAGPHR